MTQRRVIIDVDDRGRVSVARFGLKSTQLVVDQLPNGGLVLHRAVALTPAEVAYHRNPAAITALERGLADAQAGRVKRVELRSRRKKGSTKGGKVPVTSRKSSKFTKDEIGKLANDKPVVYKIRNSSGTTIYAGSAKRNRVQDRITEHLPSGKDAVPGGKTVEIVQKSSIQEAQRSEQRVIKRSQPRYNKKGK
jgi:hypothetical protein